MDVGTEEAPRALTGPESDFLVNNTYFGALALMRMLASGAGKVDGSCGGLAEACEAAVGIFVPLPDGRPVREVAEVTPWFVTPLAEAGARVTQVGAGHYLSLPGPTPDDVCDYGPVQRALAAVMAVVDGQAPAPVAA